MNSGWRDGALRQRHFLAACELDVAALKPGNVRVGTRGTECTRTISFAAHTLVRVALSQRGASVGQRVLAAIRCTQRVVQCNTNLGIVLLAAPLFCAAETGGDLRTSLARQLAGLDRRDAALGLRGDPAGSSGRDGHQLCGTT